VLDGEKARVTLAMSNGEGRKATRWTDVIVLARDAGNWCVDDVEYQGAWPFANKGKLSDKLKAEF
jgi:hypothetical protein